MWRAILRAATRSVRSVQASRRTQRRWSIKSRVPLACLERCGWLSMRAVPRERRERRTESSRPPTSLPLGFAHGGRRAVSRVMHAPRSGNVQPRPPTRGVPAGRGLLYSKRAATKAPGGGVSPSGQHEISCSFSSQVRRVVAALQPSRWESPRLGCVGVAGCPFSSGPTAASAKSAKVTRPSLCPL